MQLLSKLQGLQQLAIFEDKADARKKLHAQVGGFEMTGPVNSRLTRSKRLAISAKSDLARSGLYLAEVDSSGSQCQVLVCSSGSGF